MQTKEKPFRKKMIALTLGVALLGTVFGMALSVGMHANDTAVAEDVAPQAIETSTATALDSPFKAVYNDVSQSVVGIKLNLQRYSMNGRIITDSSFVGTGVVISDEGHVVTNYHVVTGGGTEVADDISVVYNDETYSAKYVAGDASSDVAVLQVKDLDAPAVRLGNSDELAVGDWALVVGNPLGEQFTNTLTVGVISGLDREMSNSRRSATTTSMIQTDAAINSGNSGGGLFNIRGELVGITSMKMSNNGFFGSASIEGFGFAIPINTVMDVAEDLIDYGQVVYPRMGVGTRDMVSPSDEPTKEYLPKSVWVVTVEEDSPADKAGIERDDLITEINGERVRTSDEMLKIIRAHNAGDTIEVTVYRVPKVSAIAEEQDYPEGEYLTFEVELEILDV